MRPGYQESSESLLWWKIAQHLDEAQLALSSAMAHNVDDPRLVQALHGRLREGQAILLEIFRAKGLIPGAPTVPTVPSPTVPPAPLGDPEPMVVGPPVEVTSEPPMTAEAPSGPSWPSWPLAPDEFAPAETTLDAVQSESEAAIERSIERSIERPVERPIDGQPTNGVSSVVADPAPQGAPVVPVGSSPERADG